MKSTRVRTVVLSVVTLWVFTPLSISSVGAIFVYPSIAAACACITRVPNALATVEEEQQRTAAERDAFARFASRIASFEATKSTGAAGRAESIVVAEPVKAPELCSIQEAYRETVMDVDHYEEEYDELLVTHMNEEFSAELALAVTEGETFSPQLKQALVQASNQARAERASFLQTLDQEQKSLEHAKATLMEIATAVDDLAHTRFHRRSIDKLIRMYTRSMDLEERCTQELTDRQEQLHDHSPIDGKELQEYLHASREWTYPVLLDGVNCISRIQKIERRLIQSIYRRDEQ